MVNVSEESIRRRLPLDKLTMASPCSAEWNDMVGDDRVRRCGGCQKDVYNLVGLSPADAERVIAGRELEICVRVYRRADGTLLTTDCPVGVARKLRLRKLGILSAVGAILLTAVVAKACVGLREVRGVGVGSMGELK
jgi:hypothetical protein